MSVQHYFSETYFSARDKFNAACHREGVVSYSLTHPLSAEHGARGLSTEVARFGPSDASNLLVLISGVHGVEAFAGSACQTGLIESGRMQALPPDTAVLMIHIVNCHGAANLRRNTEGNVDLCRNFLDFSQPLPDNPIYEGVHAALACPEYEGAIRDASNEFLTNYIRQHGMPAYIEAIMGGQYHHSDGFSYGGNEPVWANLTLTSILKEHAQQAKKVCLIEFHTGLGPYAYGTAVTMHTDDDLLRARDWFGEWILAPNHRDPKTDASGDGHLVKGHTTEGYIRALPSAEVTSIVLEYGTFSPMISLPVMIADHWLEHFGDPADPLGQQIRSRLLALHHPKDKHWRQAVWDRANQVVSQALDGLTKAV